MLPGQPDERGAMNTARPYIPGSGTVADQALSLRLDRRKQLQIWWREIDRVLLALIAVLAVCGVIAVALASPASANRLSTDAVELSDWHFFELHLGWLALGTGVLLGTSMLPLEKARRAGILVAGAMLAALVLVPFIGVERNGAVRWLYFGFTMQPSEFLKPAFAITLAWILSWKQRDPSLPVIGFSAGLLGLIIALLMLQPNLGEAILFAGCWFVLVVLAGLPLRNVGILTGIAGALGLLAYLFYDNARNRIDAFFSGGTAYDHVDLARRTMMDGGWTGKGPWLGQEKMRLPEAHTDYILSVVGEELGLAVCGLLVLLYLAIVLRVAVRLLDEERLFIVLSASGLVALFGGQAFINILVNLQLFPSKGMTLPMISYGGSSLIAQCFAIGLLLAITRRNPYLARGTYDFGSADERTDQAKGRP